MAVIQSAVQVYKIESCQTTPQSEQVVHQVTANRITVNFRDPVGSS